MTERKDEHLERIDAALEGLARHDAPDRVVQDTLESVRDAQTASRLPNRFRDQRWASGIAASIAAVAALAIVFPILSPERPISDADVAQTSSLRSDHRTTMVLSACAELLSALSRRPIWASAKLTDAK